MANICETTLYLTGSKKDLLSFLNTVDTEDNVFYNYTSLEEYNNIKELINQVENSTKKMTKIHFYMETKWAPSEDAILKLHEEGKLKVEAYFFEPGMCFFGSFYDSDFSYQNYEYINFLPEYIINEFGIDIDDYDEDFDED